jgi:hypothetical protein
MSAEATTSDPQAVPPFPAVVVGGITGSLPLLAASATAKPTPAARPARPRRVMVVRTCFFMGTSLNQLAQARQL